MQEDSGPCQRNKTAYVVVLGDLGRSPRMRNHALSLADEGYEVFLVGYAESSIGAAVDERTNVRLKKLAPLPCCIGRWFPRALAMIIKVLWQLATLALALPFFHGPDVILLQNPPTIPTLIFAYFYTCLHIRSRLVLDWHNYGFSILQMTLGNPRHPFVRLSELMEGFFGPRVHSAFCVSKAMKRDLSNRWGVEAVVLYDRPRKEFRPISVAERHDLLTRLALTHPDVVQLSEDGTRTAFTETTDEGQLRLRADRPGVLVSSTSWTADEDFGILFDALSAYEIRCEAAGAALPRLVCVITGKGPLKAFYRDRIASRRWQHVTVLMPWLEPEDYPLMLASADFGVCLHTSSSGVDLPMKVVDMFGCGLPVAAKNFPALPELVKDGINGVIFENADELADHIAQWFEDFPNVSYERRRRPFSSHLERFRASSWSDHWKVVALPVVQDNL